MHKWQKQLQVIVDIIDKNIKGCNKKPSHPFKLWRKKTKMATSISGIDCTKCELNRTRNGCMETIGRPFGTECIIALCLEKGMNELCEFKKNLKAAFYALNIEDMEEITEFHTLKGSLIYLEYALPKR